MSTIGFGICPILFSKNEKFLYGKKLGKYYKIIRFFSKNYIPLVHIS